MSTLTLPHDVLFFGSFLYRTDLYQISEIEKIWNLKFSHSIFFTHTYYPMVNFYSKEMGDVKNLNRFILVSTDTVSRDQLANLKQWSDSIEKTSLDSNGNRKINFDIGYISLENVVLATGKNFSHRVYLHSGVFADLTYFYEDKSYRTFSWTYPDYSHPDYINFFNFSRCLLQKKLHQK